LSFATGTPIKGAICPLIRTCAMSPSVPALHADLAAMIGNTPLMRLRGPSEATGCEILGKAEFLNPGQSVKDRAALYIIRDAMARGDAQAGWYDC
jgi:threonine dehydratase